MCGICGILALDPERRPDRQALDAMDAALAHRGPDGCGTLIDGPLGLAVRRLALVGAVDDAGPAANEDGSVRVALNGEIYGHRALRAALRRRGHDVRGASDTELLAHLYEESGPAFVRDLRGMFALALWDARRRRLLLARDRSGIKPLLLHRNGERLAFASELRALLRLEDVDPQIDPEAVETYLALGSVPGQRTMISGVTRLPPGHLLLAQDGEIRVQRFARDLPAAAGDVATAARADLAAELRERLRGAVREHLDADVPVGVLLSGGLDSGGLMALAAQERGAGIPAFTIGFPERSFDELAPARRIARHFGAEHHELVVGPADAERHLLAVAADLDEPRGDATALPYWLLARLASGEVKAALSGEGSDELLAGYQTYAASMLPGAAPALAAGLRPLLERLPASDRRLGLDFRLRRLGLGAGLAPLERHHAWKELLPAPARRSVLREAAEADPLAVHRLRFAETAGADLLARLQDVDAGTFLADDLLIQADRMGMAHGLEVRVPYLDRTVVELALTLPAGAKVRRLQTKAILREALAPLLPRGVAGREKRGFVAPVAAWLRAPLLPLLRETLSAGVLEQQGLLRPAPVAALIDRHVARREDLGRPLWALLALTLWHEATLNPRARHRALAPPRPSLTAGAAAG